MAMNMLMSLFGSPEERQAKFEQAQEDYARAFEQTTGPRGHIMIGGVDAFTSLDWASKVPGARGYLKPPELEGPGIMESIFGFISPFLSMGSSMLGSSLGSWGGNTLAGMTGGQQYLNSYGTRVFSHSAASGIYPGASFADGGIMTHTGPQPLPIKAFANGGIMGGDFGSGYWGRNIPWAGRGTTLDDVMGLDWEDAMREMDISLYNGGPFAELIAMGRGMGGIGRQIDMSREKLGDDHLSGLFGPFVSTFGSVFGGAGISMSSVLSPWNELAKASGYGKGGGGVLGLFGYAQGGIATSPQLALFGEGSTPEAFVPLPDGRTIPVTMKGHQDLNDSPSEDNRPTIVNFHISTPDANSFRASQPQIEGRMVSALSRARKRNA
jgi:hypothetical protein